MEPSTKEIGRKINNTGRELRPGPMVPNTMGSTSMERNMVKEDSLGPMVAHTTVILRIITFKVTDHTIGPMEECLLAPG